MATTNNGWTKDPPVVRIYIGGDIDGATFAVGNVATVFTSFFTEFHQKVEAVFSLNGYRSSAANAELEGSVASSNHVSGTAGDVNGLRHPNELAAGGKLLASGFNAAQTTALRNLLARYPVIKWGGDFPLHARDYMHFELRGTAAEVAAFAATLNKPPVVTPPPIPEDDMTPEQAEQLDFIFKQSASTYAFLVEVPGRSAAQTAAQVVNRVPGQPSTWKQDTADGTTAALKAVALLDQVLARLTALEAKVK